METGSSAKALARCDRKASRSPPSRLASEAIVAVDDHLGDDGRFPRSRSLFVVRRPCRRRSSWGRKGAGLDTSFPFVETMETGQSQLSLVASSSGVTSSPKIFIRLAAYPMPPRSLDATEPEKGRCHSHLTA